MPIGVRVREWRMASGTWFGETSRQSQAESVKQQLTGISPNHVPEAVPYSHEVCETLRREVYETNLHFIIVPFYTLHISAAELSEDKSS